MLIDNSVWTPLLKILMMALAEIKGSQERESADTLVQKCLALLENMLDLQPEVVSNKLMHSDNFIDVLLLMQDRRPSSIYEYADIVHSAGCAELLSTIVSSCHDDFKSKFTLTLNGMERLLALINASRNQDIET